MQTAIAPESTKIPPLSIWLIRRGYAPASKGFRSLSTAIQILATVPASDLWPANIMALYGRVAEMTYDTPSRAERNIRHLLATYNEGRHLPHETNGNAIYRLLIEARAEGVL